MLCQFSWHDGALDSDSQIIPADGIESYRQKKNLPFSTNDVMTFTDLLAISLADADFQKKSLKLLCMTKGNNLNYIKRKTALQYVH